MSQDDDELDTELPPLSDADEAYVRDLLAALPPVPVPADLAARLDAALRAEAEAEAEVDDGVGTPLALDETTVSAGTTVVPLDSRRAAKVPRSTRILQVAAVGLLVVAGGIGVVKLANHGNGAQATSAGAVPAASGAVEPVLTHSGHTYTDETLVADVRSLAAEHTPAEASRTGSLTSTPAAPGTTTPQPSVGKTPLSDSTGATPVFGAARGGGALVACLAAVEEGLTEPVTPLAMDQGSYRGQAALIVVLPGSQDPKTSYDVFVVGLSCGVDADAHLLLYQLVEAH